MSDKFCIFCGKKPKDKNLEHVIPQWLIRMTGREHSDVYSLYHEHDKHISFLQFKFPACTECNSKYADLEGKIKAIMEKVLSGQSVNGAEANLLMDWFDKIRVGMWLTAMFFDKNLKQDIQPHFFIDSRVVKEDRMLSIRKVCETDANKGIYIGGTQTPLFTYCPSAFTMRINNYYFVNASTHNLVSPRIGFPFVSNMKIRDTNDGSFFCDIINGRGKLVNPVVPSFIPNKDSITFYQPIYKDFVGFEDFTIDDYMIEHSYDVANGLGGVFVQKGNVGNTRYLHETDNVSTKIKVSPLPEMEKDICEIQNKVSSISKIQTMETECGMKYNSLILNAIKNAKIKG
ncbi:MAG: hypothetical protein IKZ49_04385 [Alphaproteobacteria bacterium]|nr:hypothetical protein [Alphaproteobacteria bacterium]